MADLTGPPRLGLDPDRVAGRLSHVRDRVEEAARKAGRSPEDVEILAATKYVPVDEMGVLAAAGIELVGENRTDSLAAKQARYGDTFTWDFVGHIQSRKVPEIVGRVRLIHSVESGSVLTRIERFATFRVDVLLQVNVAGEARKSGVLPDDVDAFVERASKLDRVRFCGLMTMPPQVERAEDNRSHFSRLREMATRLHRTWSPRHKFTELSMGTSQDFFVGVEEGATLVRIGSVLWTAESFPAR